MGVGKHVGRMRPQAVIRRMWICEGARLATDRWPGVARLLVTFFVNATKKVTKENAPRHPRIPENRARRVGGKVLAPLLLFLI